MILALSDFGSKRHHCQEPKPQNGDCRRDPSQHFLFNDLLVMFALVFDSSSGNLRRSPQITKWQKTDSKTRTLQEPTVPMNMPSIHAQIRTDRSTSPVVYPMPVPFATLSPHTVGRDIGNLINPFMRVTAEMTRYLATSRESQLLPPLTPRMWEISSLGQSKEWEDKKLCCVCDGV